MTRIRATMSDKTHYDSDDIRIRGETDLHPQFYWRAIYQNEKDNYILLPFMLINNSDTGRADWMDVEITMAHQVRYAKAWKEFEKEQPLPRKEYSREEMMRIQNFRDRIEHNKKMIRLPESHPEYWPLISDFSLKLNLEDIEKLNAIDGVVIEKEEEKPEVSKEDKILSALSMFAEKLDSVVKRVDALEEH